MGYSRDIVTEIVRSRTDIFRSNIINDVNGVNGVTGVNGVNGVNGGGMGKELSDIKSTLEDIKTPEKLFDVIYNCPFVGFVDGKRKRVGCMIHPATNDGVEFRDVSFYGSALCSGHECPSFTYLSKVEKEGVIAIIDDWYLYGLVITDIDFVKEFFTIVGNRLGEEIRPEKLKIPEVRGAALKFFELKETWPFATTDRRFGKYSFSIAEYRIEREISSRNRTTSCRTTSCPISPESKYERIFISLASDFKTEGELRKGLEIVEGYLNNFVSIYTI